MTSPGATLRFPPQFFLLRREGATFRKRTMPDDSDMIDPKCPECGERLLVVSAKIFDEAPAQ